MVQPVGPSIQPVTFVPIQPVPRVGAALVEQAKQAFAQLQQPLALPQTQALTTAVAQAAGRQDGLAPLMADLDQAMETPDLPAPVRAAAAEVLKLQTPLKADMAATDVRQAVSQSGLFLEARLATAPQRSPGPDLKAALLVLRQVLVQAAPAQAAPTAPAASAAPQAATAAPAAMPQPAAAGPATTAAAPTTPGAQAVPAQAAAAPQAPIAQPPEPETSAAPPASPQAAAPQAATPQTAATASAGTPPAATPSAPLATPAAPAATPAQGAPAAAPAAATVADAAAEAAPDQTLAALASRGPAPSPAASPPAAASSPAANPAALSAKAPALAPQQSLPLPSLSAASIARASAEAGAAAARDSLPPPYRGGPVRAQRAAAPTLPAGAAAPTVTASLLKQTDAALAREELLQAASLPEGPRRAEADPETARSEPARWMLDIPLTTPQGPAVAQMEISRDGRAPGSAPTDEPVWRVRFSIDAEPLGPVHAAVVMQGGQAHVGLWAERPDSAADLRGRMGELTTALSEAADAVEVSVYTGAPPQAAPQAGRLVDQSS